jgi:tetratricopeptide (TPR) repeat protein
MNPYRRFKKWYVIGMGIFLVVAIIGMAGLILVRTNTSVAWRFDNLMAKVKYALNPPEKVIFVPQDQISLMVSATLKALTPSITPTLQSILAVTPTLDTTPRTPTVTPTSIPDRKLLTGFRHEYQGWNNCGPTNLAMILSFWGWVGDQSDTAAYLKPNPRDKNVMPSEMQAYIEENTDLSVLTRYGGDLKLLQTFIAAGFPVLIERGFEGADFKDWMGHYEVISGYDRAQEKVYAQDSYTGPDYPIPNSELESYWRAFNYIYLIVYPAEREAEVLQLLGPQADEAYNLSYTAELSTVETVRLTRRDLFFAWYNRGTSLVNLVDYTGAALAYDEAYKVYPTLEEADRPWRMVWYQTGPYFAYYYTGRYYDVISLATSTLSIMNEPILEETYVWRARARAALGDNTGAIDDLNLALKYHPDYAPALEELVRLTGQ